MENSTFQQLMITEQTSELTIEQRNFVETHKQIISCGRMAGRYFVELARKLKQMRDGKLYLAAGFPDFEAYVEEAVGIKKRHAYNYIRVAETYSDEYLEAHAGVGVTKLTLLAQVQESVRAGIEEEIDIDTASTTEVKEAVQAALRERDKAHEQLSLIQSKLEEKDTELTENEQARAALQSAYDDQKKKLLSAKETEKKLKEQVATLKKERDAMAAAPKTVETVEVENPETVKKLKEAEAALQEANLAAQRAQEEREIAEKQTQQYQDQLVAYKRTQEATAKFKVYAETLFATWADVIEAVGVIGATDSELAEKCRRKLVTFSEQVQEDVKS